MRIASISKSIGAVIIARLVEEGRLDLDRDVREYLSAEEWPRDEGKARITTRLLMNHMAGIRHYDKTYMDSNREDNVERGEGGNEGQKEEETGKTSTSVKAKTKKSNNNLSTEFDLEEYHIQRRYKSVKESLELFKHDPLVSKPGTKFLYSSHGWTLVSAVAQSALGGGVSIEKCLTDLFSALGMTSTHLDKHETIVYNRARHYKMNGCHQIENVPYVDNSYKWVGGGLLSTVADIVKFGNAMLYSYQFDSFVGANKLQPVSAASSNNNTIAGKHLDSSVQVEENPVTVIGSRPDAGSGKAVTVAGDSRVCGRCRTLYLPGYLKSSTVEEMWQVGDGTIQASVIGGRKIRESQNDKLKRKERSPNDRRSSDSEGSTGDAPAKSKESAGVQYLGYGLGWYVANEGQDCAYCRPQSHTVSHTGGAIGATSVLIVRPSAITPAVSPAAPIDVCSSGVGKTTDGCYSGVDVTIDRCGVDATIDRCGSGMVAPIDRAYSSRLVAPIDSTTCCSRVVAPIDSMCCSSTAPPRGVVVAAITNLENCSLTSAAARIAKIFECVDVRQGPRGLTHCSNSG